MKKFTMTLAAVLCCTMTTSVFTSCGDDDKEEVPTPTKKELLGIGARYIISVTRQMTEYCDYTITYYAEDNQLKTETMQWSVKDNVATWQKDANSIVIPATFGVKVNVKVKEGVQLEGVKIDNIYPTAKLLYAEGITKDGQKAWGKTVDLNAGASARMGCSGEKLINALEVIEQQGGLLNYTYTFDEEGNKVSTGKIQ